MNDLVGTGSDSPPLPRMSLEELDYLIGLEIPPESALSFRFEQVEFGRVRVRLKHDARHLRSGGSIAGPVIFTLADTALFCAVLSTVGRAQLSLTTDMSIRFLSRPAPRDLVADARILKPGGRLVVGEVQIYSVGHSAPVAHATGTFAVPRFGGGDRAVDR